MPRNFDQKFKFRSKFQLKIEILVKKRNFGQKSNFCLKNRKFDHDHQFCAKFEILVKTRNFAQNYKRRRLRGKCGIINIIRVIVKYVLKFWSTKKNNFRSKIETFPKNHNGKMENLVKSRKFGKNPKCDC